MEMLNLVNLNYGQAVMVDFKLKWFRAIEFDIGLGSIELKRTVGPRRK